MEKVRMTCRLFHKTCFTTLILISVFVMFRFYKATAVERYRPLTKRNKVVLDLMKFSEKIRTRPPYYPRNGTGVSIDIFSNFNISQSVQNSMCVDLNKASLIIPVYSTVRNFERRQAIRQTFGKTCRYLKQGCKLFFIIGVDLNHSLFEKVLEEYEAEADILLINKVDTYRDLNNKAVAMIDWIDTFCSSASYVLHVIDDVYPNIHLFMDVLRSIEVNDFILGYVVPMSDPARLGIFKVTEEEYPYEKFPAYVSGTAYAFPMSTVRRLKEAIFSAPYCWIEDVWFTGMVRKMAGVNMVELTHRFQEYPNLTVEFMDTPYYHHVDIGDFYELHKLHHTKIDLWMLLAIGGVYFLFLFGILYQPFIDCQTA